MELVVAHKGKKSWRCRVRGFEAHSSLTPHGVNAVQIACEIVAYLAAMARAFRDRGPLRRRLRRAVHDRAHRRHPRRHRAQHRAARLHVRLRDPPPAVRRSRRVLRRSRGATRERFLPEMRAVDAGHATSSSTSSRRCPASTRTATATIAALGHACNGTHGLRQGVVRHRGVAVPRRRRSRRSSAAPATSRRRTSPTSGSRSSSSRAARRSCAASPTASASRERTSPADARRMATTAAATAPIEVDFRTSTAGPPATPASPTSGRFAAERPGPHVLLQALTHGNEVCGAIALDWLLRAAACGPMRGTLTVVFANVDAYRTFDRADPFASRCVDEDFNRLWTADVLDGPRSTRRPRARPRAAAALRPRRLPARPALDDRPLPAARAGRAGSARASSSRGRSGCPSTSSSTAATRPASGCATTRSSTMPTIRATRC